MPVGDFEGDGPERAVTHCCPGCAHLQAMLAIATKALRHYGRPGNWRWCNEHFYPGDGPTKALAALRKIKEADRDGS